MRPAEDVDVWCCVADGVDGLHSCLCQEQGCVALALGLPAMHHRQCDYGSAYASVASATRRAGWQQHCFGANEPVSWR